MAELSLENMDLQAGTFVGGQKRGIQGPKYVKKLSHLQDFLNVCMAFNGFRKVLIIPKWLIKVSGSVPICFGSFLELSEIGKKTIKSQPFHIFVITKILEKKQKKCGDILKDIISHLDILETRKSKMPDTTGHHLFGKLRLLFQTLVVQKQLVSPSVLN